MTDRITCPRCNGEFGIEDIIHGEDVRACLRMIASDYGRHGDLVLAYCFLLEPSPGRRIKKFRVLLKEMKALFEAEEFAFQKKRYRISEAGIVEALSTTTHRHFTTRLENHNYLKKIMIGIAAWEEQAAGRQAEGDLRSKEARLMSGSRDKESSAPEGEHAAGYPIPEESVEPPAVTMKSLPPAYLTPAQIEENRRRLQKLIKGIGG